MFKRLFFAINIDCGNKEKILPYHQKVQLLLKDAVKMVPLEDTHITLMFLGNIRSDKVEEIITKANQVKYPSFVVNFSRAGVFPKNKKLAKLVWLEGEGSDVASLSSKIQKEVNNKESEAVTPHITVARLRKWEVAKKSPYLLDQIEEEIPLTVVVNSFSLMESKLTKKGPHYSELQNFPLIK